MKLLLTGAPRTGKTTILRRLAEAYPGNAGGTLVTELAEGGKRCGFELQAVWSPPGGRLQILERATLAMADQWSPLKAGRYAVSPDAIDLAVRAIDAAMHEGGLVIIDEIGPLQATSTAFQDAVLRCLDSTCHLIGTISTSTDPFIEQVRYRPGVRLLEVTRANRLHLVEGLLPWLV